MTYSETDIDVEGGSLRIIAFVFHQPGILEFVVNGMGIGRGFEARFCSLLVGFLLLLFLCRIPLLN